MKRTQLRLWLVGLGLAATLTLLLGTAISTAQQTASATGDVLAASRPALSGPQAVNASAIVLAKTVGTDAGVCATADAITVTAGSLVTYCYEVTNTGDVTFTLHDLVDDQLGPILTAFTYTLAPGASAFLTASATITETTLNTAIWTAYSDLPTETVTSTAFSTVNVSVPTETPTTTPTATATEEVTATATSTATATPTEVVTSTATSTATATATEVVTATATSTATATEEVTATATSTVTPTPTGTLTATPSATPTPTATLPTLPPGSGSIQGWVFIDVNGDGIHQHWPPYNETAGIPGVSVNLYLDGNLVKTTQTYPGAFGGFYGFSNLPAGNYTVEQVQPEGYASTSANLIEITLTTGQQVFDQTFGELPATSTPTPTTTATATATPTATITPTATATPTVTEEVTATATATETAAVTATPTATVTPTATQFGRTYLPIIVVS